MSRAVSFLSLSCAPFLATSVVLHEEPSDACECLGWQDAFKVHGADCGKMGDETCAKFFMQIPNDKLCLNENFGKLHPRHWCYVSPSCKEGKSLEWSTKPTDVLAINPYLEAKYRWCGEEEPKLGDKLPLELREWTKKNDLEIGLAVHFAYPTFPGKLTNDFLDFFGLQAPADAPAQEFASPPLSAEYRASLEKVAETGRPILFLSTAGHPPFGIMKGKKLYWLNFSDEQLQLVTSGKDFFSHKGIMNAVKCVAGCEEPEESTTPWMSPINGR